MDPLVELGPEDSAHLEWARRIGRQGWGHVHPNPMVGCVLVREGRTVGEGYHEVFGGPHAEIVALEQALGSAEGSTAYVSLEPCSHHGKTPPCSEALIEAGVTRVVFGAADPGDESGGGAEQLREAGVDVVGPVWAEAVGRAENPEFFHTARFASPFVALKLATSLDGRIASAPGTRTRITGVEAEREVHRLRTGFDAVMVGAGTVLADDPRLTPRLVPSGRQPTRRVVVSSDASLPAEATLFKDIEVFPLHVVCREDVPESAIGRLESAGAHVHPVPGATGQDGALDLGAALNVCWEVGIRSVLCEGGARLASSLLRERRVHRLYHFVAPTTLGSAGLSAFPDDGDELEWSDFEVAEPPQQFGRDTVIVLDRQEG